MIVRVPASFFTTMPRARIRGKMPDHRAAHCSKRSRCNSCIDRMHRRHVRGCIRRHSRYRTPNRQIQNNPSRTDAPFLWWAVVSRDLHGRTPAAVPPKHERLAAPRSILPCPAANMPSETTSLRSSLRSSGSVSMMAAISVAESVMST